MDFKKMISRTTQKIKDEGNRTIINENRTFFCSEIVAKACKEFGIIENNLTSCS